MDKDKDIEFDFEKQLDQSDGQELAVKKPTSRNYKKVCSMI